MISKISLSVPFRLKLDQETTLFVSPKNTRGQELESLTTQPFSWLREILAP